MDVRHLSTTILQGWPVCPARSWEEYERRLDEGDSMEGANPTRFGSIVHEVAEIYHQNEMMVSDVEDLPAPIDLFDEVWEKHQLADYEYFLLGRDNIEDFLERTLFDRNGSTVAVELVFVYDVRSGEVWIHPEDIDALVDEIIGAGGVPVVSKIDRVDKVTDEVYEVYDYKTNMIPFSRWEVDNSVQLGIYDLVIREVYPEAEHVRCVYDMFRHGRQPTIFDDEQRETLRAYLIRTWHQIRDIEEPEERINTYCCWCDRRGSCDAYLGVLTEEVQPILTDDLDDPESLLSLYEEYEFLKDKAKILEARQGEIKDMFAAKKAEDKKDIELEDGSEVYFQPNPRYEYSMRDLWATLDRHDSLTLLRDVANISNTKLKRALKGRPELQEAVEPLMETRYVKPSMKRRKHTEEEDDG